MSSKSTSIREFYTDHNIITINHNRHRFLFDVVTIVVLVIVVVFFVVAIVFFVIVISVVVGFFVVTIVTSIVITVIVVDVLTFQFDAVFASPDLQLQFLCSVSQIHSVIPVLFFRNNFFCISSKMIL